FAVLLELSLDSPLDNQIQNQTNAITNNTNRLEQRETKLIKIIPFADAAIWYNNANQQKAFEYWDMPNQANKKICKFITSLRIELQIAVCLFGENTWNRVVNRAKICELTCYGVAIYITSNLNNNILTLTPISSNSVKIIIEARTKYIKNLKKKIEKKLENNNYSRKNNQNNNNNNINNNNQREPVCFNCFQPGDIVWDCSNPRNNNNQQNNTLSNNNNQPRNN
ncbi:28351_t:CDS:2, partial [Racocetra persica]